VRDIKTRNPIRLGHFSPSLSLTSPFNSLHSLRLLHRCILISPLDPSSVPPGLLCHLLFTFLSRSLIGGELPGLLHHHVLISLLDLLSALPGLLCHLLLTFPSGPSSTVHHPVSSAIASSFPLCICLRRHLPSFVLISLHPPYLFTLASVDPSPPSSPRENNVVIQWSAVRLNRR
jgi:hypothetical protein